MTDRELLELAAKAHGEIITDHDYGLIDPKSNTATQKWNPLVDDGDALRLALKLGVTVFIMSSSGFTGIYLPDCPAIGKYDEVQMHKNDPAHATRRAITMAAAQIGEAMA